MFIKKIVSLVTAIAVSLGLCSCSKPFLSHSWDNSGTLAEARLQEIICALESKDADALKKMFSPKALEEATDIDSGIAYAMKFYEGNMISKVKGAAEGWKNVNGAEKCAGTKPYYTVKTDKDEYGIFFIETTVNTEHPEEIGVYMLQIIKENDFDTQFDWGGKKTLCAGVYQPPED